MNSTLLSAIVNAGNRFNKTVLALILLFAGIAPSNAQMAGYTATNNALATYSGLTGSTTLIQNGGTGLVVNPVNGNAVSSFLLPFPVNINGKVYPVNTVIHVSLNGFMTIGTAPSPTEITPISSTAGYEAVIAPLAQDLDLAPGGLVSWFIDPATVAPNRILKVQWIARRSNDVNTQGLLDSGLSPEMRFQVWIYETTNVIEFHYSLPTIVYSAGQITFPQVGLRGVSNEDYKNARFTPANGPWNSTAMEFNAACATTPVPNNATLAVGPGVPINRRRLIFTPPPCFAPNNITASCPTPTTVNLSWSAPTPAPSSGYDYLLTTSATAPDGSTTPTGSVGAGVTSATVTGLTAGTVYNVWVRSNCGAASCWVKSTSVTTPCSSVNVPYGMFADPVGDSFAVPALPACTTIQQLNTATNAVNWVTAPASFGDGFFDEHLVYNGNSTTANVWYFTRGVNLTAGTVYRLSYLYGGSTDFAFLTNRMEVAYGLSPCAASMTTQLANHPNIKASPIDGIVNFTCTATGTYYFGFRAYSLPNNGKLFLDDIQIVAPGCSRVLSSSSFNVTSTTASLTWPVPSPAPFSGYAYFLSTSPTPPTYTQAASGTTGPGINTVTITGLTGNTTYYFWVRTVCGPGDFGEWSAVHSFTTANLPVFTYCTPAPTSVDGQGIVNVTVGSINNSTGAEPGNYGNYSAQITNVAQGQSVTVAITFNTLTFTYNTQIWIDWNNDSDFADAGENVFTGLSASSSPNTLLATFTVPLSAPLGEHRMRIGGADIDPLTGFGPGQGPCYNGSWGTFEDYTVNVTVPPPALTISAASDTKCAGTPSVLVTLTSPVSNYDTYTWTPAIGVSGDPASGWTFTNSTSITYTLTAVQTSLPFASNTVSFRYNANPLPTPITISPATPLACPGSAVALTAAGGVVGGLPILTEDFNGSAPGWTFTTGTTPTPHAGGNTTAALWTLRPNGFNPGGSSGVGPMSSNDATQFVISNSDAQGSGTQTNVVMTSPVFSLVGFTSASLRFFHYYKPWVNGYARVSISTDGGTTWTQILNWGTSFAETQGTPTNFDQEIFSLDPYVGQANLRIRFDYYTSWGYVWAIDNFLVSGSASSAVTWTPVTGLFTDAAMTIPYTAGTGTNVVYAAPSSTTTYTASAATPAPTVCSTSTPVTVTVPTLVIGTAGPTNQPNCSGIANDITLVGSAGTVIHWESSANATFTTPVVIPGSASATLTSAQIGLINANRWFRALVSVGGCSVYSNVVTITYNSSVWNGTAWSPIPPNSSRAAIFNGNFSSTANINACTCIIQSGNVVINPGHTLSVVNQVERLGTSTLTFENTASLRQTNDASVNIGSIVYMRNTTPVRRFDYTYWSSPLSPQTLVGLSPLTLFDKYFEFNTAANTFVNVSSNSLMVPGKGYIIRAPQPFSATVPAVFNGVFDGGANDGVPNNGVINIPIVLAGANNFNLIGNPYPSALSANSFYLANSSLIDGTFYFWTHNTNITNNQYTGSDYAVWNAVGGIGTAGGGVGNTTVPNGNIAAGQGFMVKSTANGTAVFNNSMRVVGNNSTFYRMANDSVDVDFNKHRIWLEMTNAQGAYKQTLLGYVPGATNAKENAFDSEIAEAGNVISLYTLADDYKLSIQGRALPFVVEDVVPLGYRTSAAGMFDISLSQFDGLFASHDVFLEDYATGVIHNLKDGPYSFTTETGVFDTRFAIRYTNGTLGSGDNVLSPNSVVAFKDNTNIQIQSAGFEMKTVEVYDVRGRMLYKSDNVLSASHTVSGLQVAEQVLVIKIISTDNKQVSKKIVF